MMKLGPNLIAKAPFRLPAVRSPQFTATETTHWSLKLKEFQPPILRAFYSGLTPLSAPLWILRNKTEGVLWMSNSPLELESQAPVLLAARTAGRAAQKAGRSGARVLVLGLGMGIIAANLAADPLVAEVLVVERDPEVRDIVERCAEHQRWSGWTQKVTVQIGDALVLKQAEFIPEKFRTLLFDLAYADIWPMIGDTALREDLRLMSERFNALAWWAWSLDLDFVTYLLDELRPRISLRTAGALHWRSYAEHIGVALCFTKRHREAARAAKLAVAASINSLLL